VTPRERFLTALEHREPDRVPIFANLTPQVGETLAEALQAPVETVPAKLSQRVSHTEILTRLGNDAVAIRPTWPKAVQARWAEGILVDDFGFEFVRLGYYTEIVKRPLAAVETAAQVEAYRTPDPELPETWELAKQQVDRYRREFAIIGALETTIFELAWNLVGLEQFMIDLLLEKPYVPLLLDKILDYNLACGVRMVRLGADMIWTGDDFGTQRAMLVSPELWRKHFKPRMRCLFRALKATNPKVKIAYHSCGSILPIIPDLIDIGLEVLNPIQPGAQGMDLGRLKGEYGQRLAFFGGVDEQTILPFGTPDQVAEEVRLRVRQAAAGGGFIIAPAHNIQPDTPLANIHAFFEAVRRWGRYPLQGTAGEG